MAVTLSLPVLALAAILQTTLVPLIFRVANGEPDLIFLIVLSWALHGRQDQTIVWAFVGGICADLLSAAPTGATVIGLLITIAIVGWLRSQVYRVGFVSHVGLVITGTLIHKTIYILLLSFVGFRVPILGALLNVVLPTLVYNLIAMVPIYLMVRSLQRRFGGDMASAVKVQG
ncbi:MAG: rod shape-determining protein MreD [Chloroflexi bacterium]|nr:rod shape-determining protein MreD [Chloroflexota bacterium]